VRRKRLTSILAIAVSACALLAGGCASPANNAPAAKAPAAGATSAAKTSAADGTVHFIGDSKNSDGPDFTVILTGAIGDYGQAVTVLPNGRIDPEHTSELRLGLQKGSFRLSIVSLHRELRSADNRWVANRTCSFHLSVTAAAPVVPGSGTGLYRGISGSFNLTVTIDEVDAKPCPHGTTRFFSQLIFVVGSGTVSFS
jgi:hypothetical protein